MYLYSDEVKQALQYALTPGIRIHTESLHLSWLLYMQKNTEYKKNTSYVTERAITTTTSPDVFIKSLKL